jgi:arabinose-5-phosphate isomerase
MTANPRTISPDDFAAHALDLLEQRKITSLMVVGVGNELQGVVHLHDLWGVELV